MTQTTHARIAREARARDRRERDRARREARRLGRAVKAWHPPTIPAARVVSWRARVAARAALAGVAS